LAAVVREAQGSVRDALSLLDQVLSYAGNAPSDEAVVAALGLVDRGAIFALFDAVLERDADKLLSMIADIDVKGHELGDVAALFVDHLRDVMVAKSVKEPTEAQLDRSPGEVEQLRTQAKKLSAPDLHRMFALAVEVADDVSRSSFARVSFEMGLLRLLEVEPTERLGELLARLDGAGTVSAKAPLKAEKPTPIADNRSPVAESRKPIADNRTPIAEKPTPAAPPGEANWSAFVATIRATKPGLSAVLEHGRPLTFGADGVELGYPPKTFYWEKAHDPECKAAIEASLAAMFGKPVPLKLTAVAPAEQVKVEESLAEAADRKRKNRHEEIVTGAREHPAVRGAIQILGGEIKEVIVRESDAEG
ncbi:MAG TPA: hypothetical protein VLC93_16520, partial [Myxococcota bacterium]|nr:hypothetical protein [Myxococcota bacterium]